VQTHRQPTALRRFPQESASGVLTPAAFFRAGCFDKFPPSL